MTHLRLLAPVAIASLVSGSALAQAVPAPPPPTNECGAFGGIPNGTPPPPAPGGGGGDVIDPGFGFIQVLSPPAGSIDVPRNVEIRLGGSVSGLDTDPPVFSVELRSTDTSRVAFTRDGATLRPTTPLKADATYIIAIAPTVANPCPDCVGTQEIPFTTGAVVDTEAPALEGDVPVHVFVMPDAAEAARCGLFFSQTHQVVIDFGPQFPTNTRIDVVGRTADGDAKNIVEMFNSGSPIAIVSDLGPTLPVALGDEFFFAVAARDLAGNVGPTRIIRDRARSFIEENKPRDELTPLWCSLPSSPQVDVPSSLPANGRIQVTFPFEEIPVALLGSDGAQTPLVPIDNVDDGHVYNTVQPMPAGAHFDVVALACPHCVCKACAAEPGTVLGSLDVAAPADSTPPAPPSVRDLREDSEPHVAATQACQPDRPALVVVLDPGQDDNSAPLDLRYDAVISVNDGPPLLLGHSLVPLLRADGSTVLRVETHGLGRLLGQRFALTLDAIDAGGNHATATVQHGVSEGAGCAATTHAAPITGLALALLALGRRRRPTV